MSQANILSICSYYFHLVRANPLNIDRMWSNTLQIKEANSTTFLALLPLAEYYNNISSKFQQSRPSPPFRQQLPSRLESAFYLQNLCLNTPLLSCNKNVIIPPAKLHHTWTEKDPDASICIIFNYFT